MSLKFFTTWFGKYETVNFIKNNSKIWIFFTIIYLRILAIHGAKIIPP